jgi:translation elongation factor EF-1beta
MPDDKLTREQFAEKIKSKYPEYKDVDNNELVDRIIKKYPDYKDQVQEVKKKRLFGFKWISINWVRKSTAITITIRITTSSDKRSTNKRPKRMEY